MKYFKIILILFIPISLAGQDVEQEFNTLKDRWNKDPLKLSSSIGFNSTLSRSSNADSYRIPFGYNVFGNINFDFLGIQAPLGFFYSNQNTQFNLPAYRFVGISPSYKGYTLHLGDRNMQFSPYTFNNIGFTGVGIEVENNGLHVKSFYGRIQRATIKDINTRNNFTSAFKRMAWGSAAEYKIKNSLFGLQLFHASDDVNSIPIANPDSIKPQSNSILGLKFEQKFGIISWKSEYAFNALSKDASLENSNDNKHLLSLVNKDNNSTGIYNAFRTAIEVSINKSLVGIDFERIDPGYESLGTLFFNNDMETISSFLRMPLLKNKLQTNFRFGLQRNNLKKTRINSYKRWTTSANISYQASKNTSFNLAFNNFQFDQKTYINPKPFLDVDTILITQNNLNAGLGLNHNLNDKNKILISLSYNNSNSRKNDIIQQNADVTNILGNAMYMINASNGLNYGFTLTYSNLNYALGNTTLLGPSAQMSKDWIKEKWSSSFSASFFSGNANKMKNQILRFYLTNNYSLTKELKTNFQIMFNNIKNNNEIANIDLFLNLSINYTMESKNIIKSFKKKQLNHEI